MPRGDQWSWYAYVIISANEKKWIGGDYEMDRSVRVSVRVHKCTQPAGTVAPSCKNFYIGWDIRSNEHLLVYHMRRPELTKLYINGPGPIQPTNGSDLSPTLKYQHALFTSSLDAGNQLMHLNFAASKHPLRHVALQNDYLIFSF